MVIPTRQKNFALHFFPPFFFAFDLRAPFRAVADPVARLLAADGEPLGCAFGTGPGFGLMNVVRSRTGINHTGPRGVSTVRACGNLPCWHHKRMRRGDSSNRSATCAVVNSSLLMPVTLPYAEKIIKKSFPLREEIT
jgi:hypothetical protein